MVILLWLSQPHFEASVRMRLTLPKVGTWSPPWLLQLQSSIAKVKKPCIDIFFIPLERARSVDVENGLVWAIRTFAAQVMFKRRAGSQIGSLTPDHKKSGIDPTDTPLESSWGKLQVCFRPRSNPRSKPGVVTSQSSGSPNRDYPGTPP
jgi:hypothetical protein